MKIIQFAWGILMSKYFLFLSIFLFSSLNAGWANYWNSIKHGFKNVFSYKYVTRQHIAADLNSFTQLLKKDIETQKLERRKISNDRIIEEMKKTGISDFFNNSKPVFSTIGIFNTSEAAFLIHEIKSTMSKAQKKQEELDASENPQSTGNSRSEKRPSIRDMRELTELGAYEHNPSMAKNMIYFKANSTANNHARIQISLIERILATKRMQNRVTGLIEEVPTTKKQVKIMVIGTENDNGTFSWEKITNDMSAQHESPKEAGKVTFNDNLSASSLEPLRLKFPKFVNGHPGLKAQ